MARPRDLVPGNCYFTLHYYDDDLQLPDITTLIHRGVDEYLDGGRCWLFVTPEHDPEDTVTIGFSDEQLYGVLDIAELRNQLMELSDFHPLSAPPSRDVAVGMSEGVLNDLRARIGAFLADPECSAFTTTIAFTDDGLSIGRRIDGAGLEMSFYPHPKRNDEGERISSLFALRGIAPHRDYLADRGRTRIMAFAITDDVDTIANLCASVFTEVHAIHLDDTLQYDSRLKG